jgi:glucokinase
MPKHYVGIDLGGTYIKFITLSQSLKPGKVLQLDTPRGADAVIDQMVAGARQVIELNKLTRRDIGGVGVGAPGPLDFKRGVVIEMPNLPGFRNVAIRDRVARGLGIRAVLENDANAAGFGEYLCGAGKHKGDMVLLTLGTGVGGGIVIDGKVIRGAHGVGAELGHLIIVPGGEPCGCGQRGCLERYCSATFIAQRAGKLVKSGRRSTLKKVLDAGEPITTKAINQARKAGDKLAAEVWDQGAYYLALGCVNICRVLDPDRIVLAGGLVNAGRDLMAPVLRHFKALHWKLATPKTEIAIATLGSDAGVIGAAGVAWYSRNV